MDAFERAKTGRGTVIAVKGEAGLGKSRLKYEAARAASSQGVAVHEGRAVSYIGMPYWVVGELVKNALGIPAMAGSDAVLAAVIASVRHLDTSYDELLMAGVPREDARQRVRAEVQAVLDTWQSAPPT